MTGVRAFVALGSNLGDPAQQIHRALEAISAIDSARLLRVSRLYRSPPWGPVAQPAFVNAVAELACVLEPAELLAELLAIEVTMGRERRERWGPRIIDLDLLWFGGRVVDTPTLSIPHPHLAERAFVLQPWADLDPGCVVPGRGSVGDLLREVDCAGLEPIP